MEKIVRLGVNVDHVATLRQARGTIEPDPSQAALICQRAGAHSIVAHLREDRRHIQERDVHLIKEAIQIQLNMEMAATRPMLKIAQSLKPHQSTLVPEKREELTTEGGLDLAEKEAELRDFIQELKNAGILASLFIDPQTDDIALSKKLEADAVELHTGSYANSEGKEQEKELARLRESAALAHKLGLEVHAGHGLTYQNVTRVAQLPYVEELNIGHSIISRSVFSGLEEAVKEMLELINKGTFEE